MFNYIIVHYGEIGLKGKNRPFFEKKLVKNIKESLADQKIVSVKNIYGRIVIKLETDFNKEQVTSRLQKVCGVVNFAFAVLTASNIEDIKKKSLRILADCQFETFRVTAQRADKNFPLNSQQINEQVGEYILNNFKQVRVDLEKPEINFQIEITDQGIFLYTQKIKSVGGLPVGVSGKVVSLLSSGFDSPVASFKLMKRGAKVIFVHFHAYPQTSQESIKNVQEIVKVLCRYQFESKLYLIPFLNIQKEVAKIALADRVIIYRRMMLRIAQKIADKERAQALVTGDSLGQVASQTLENLRVVGSIAEFSNAGMPILRPLIGMDKEEIMQVAREIGTYDISSQPYGDCCSVFIPRNPTIKADIKVIERQEKKLAIDLLVEKALEFGKIETIIGDRF